MRPRPGLLGGEHAGTHRYDGWKLGKRHETLWDVKIYPRLTNTDLGDLCTTIFKKFRIFQAFCAIDMPGPKHRGNCDFLKLRNSLNFTRAWRSVFQHWPKVCIKLLKYECWVGGVFTSIFIVNKHGGSAFRFEFFVNHNVRSFHGRKTKERETFASRSVTRAPRARGGGGREGGG